MQKSASAQIIGPSDRRIMRMARRDSAPANATSGIPSGNGITAAIAIDGGPPTNMLTRSGSPFARAAA